VDKINEIVIAVSSGLLGVGLWIFKRLFKSIDIAHERIDKLESKQMDRQYLETQLAPIRKDLNIILEHLLGNKK
jgi:hypothetical protein|tara:strand:+ start:29 stop:250 length:222 start_codon:yes stop_codon:yes gene_type:complete